MFARLQQRLRTRSRPVEDDAVRFDEDFQRRLEALALVSKRAVRGKDRAERRSRKTGSGVEFADYREYAPGDDFRRVDWQAFARFDKLLVRLFHEDEDLSVTVLVDSSASMAFGRPSKHRFAKQLAAAFAYISLANLDRVTVVSAANGAISSVAASRARHRIFAIFDFLARTTPSGGTDLVRAARHVVATGTRRGVVFVLSDFFAHEGYERAMDVLRYAKFDVALIHLVHPDDADMEFFGDLRLVDAETGESRDVTATPALRAQYRAAYDAHRRRVSAYAREKHLPYLALDVTQPFDTAVLRVLRHGGLVA